MQCYTVEKFSNPHMSLEIRQASCIEKQKERTDSIKVYTSVTATQLHMYLWRQGKRMQ